MAFTRAVRAAANVVDAEARAALRVCQAGRAFGLLDARLARRLAEIGDAVVIAEAGFADDTLVRANLAAIDVGLGSVLQAVAASRALALVLEAVAALAINADDALLAVRAFRWAASAAIKVCLVTANLAVVRAAEEAVVDDQVAVVVDAVAFLGDEPRLGARYAFGLRFAERAFNFTEIARRIRVLGEEARIADARDTVIDAAIAIVVEAVAKLNAWQSLAGA